jgi:hypothetical protein
MRSMAESEFRGFKAPGWTRLPPVGLQRSTVDERGLLYRLRRTGGGPQG